jgi:hypothetical protein
MDADPALPGSEALLGEGARHVLAPAVAAAGGTLLDVRPSQIRYNPGRRLVVRYAATVQWADGSRRTETLGALVQRRALPDDLAIVEGDDGARIGIWRYPHDPFLPGLPAAAYPEGAQAVLHQLGLGNAGVNVEPLVYRPGSRAVLRVTTPERVVYMKVVRPGRARRLHAVHDAFGAVTRVPRCLASSDDLGLLVLEALPGYPLTVPLVEGGPLPSPADVVAQAAAIAEVALPADDGPRSKPAPVRDHVRSLTRALPAEQARLERLAAMAVDLGTGSQQTVHGDFYEAQILVDGAGAISGLLDIDGAAAGSPVDDPAMMIGHLVGLAHVHPAVADRIASYRTELQQHFARDLDVELFRAAVTGVLIGLATTPFRRQDAGWQAAVAGWLELAEQWATGER